MPPKPKGLSKKTKGATATVPKKETQKAAKHAQALEQLQQNLYETEGEEACLTGDEAVPTTWEDLTQRMDVVITMLLDLSCKVQATEAQPKGWALSSLASPSASSIVRRAKPKTTTTHESDVSEEVRWRVEHKLWHIHISEVTCLDSNSTSDEEQPTTRKRRPLKAGLNHSRATMVVKWITWPHEVQYTVSGKPATYENVSVSSFAQGYLIIMQCEDIESTGIMTQHLEELTGDCLQGWDKVRAYHGVVLNQMEQWHLSWKGTQEKLKFRQALVWHSASQPTVPSLAQPTSSYTSSGTRKYHKTAGQYNAQESPGTEACELFKQGMCHKGAEHPDQ